MKKTFTHASKGPTPDIKTRAELLQRVHQRAKPAPQQHLRPPGLGTTVINRQVEAENEKRIATLRSSLYEKRLQLRRDLRLAKDRGAAAAGLTKLNTKERTR